MTTSHTTIYDINKYMQKDLPVKSSDQTDSKIKESMTIASNMFSKWLQFSNIVSIDKEKKRNTGILLNILLKRGNENLIPTHMQKYMKHSALQVVQPTSAPKFHNKEKRRPSLLLWTL